jgi:hypothetical protein
MTPSYQENIQPLTRTEEQAICRVIEKIHAAMERKHGPTYVSGDRERVAKIEAVILSDPNRSSVLLAERAGCSRHLINRHRARMREEGKIR